MQQDHGSLKAYLSPLGAWALAFGCTIGWGAFLVPGTILPSSGLAGSIIGVVLGIFLMLVIAWNFHTMMNLYPKAGGAFTYVSHVLGYDHGFLCAWFSCLMYMGLIWANVSAFALLARYALGGVLQAHYLWSIAGFDIYLEETLLCVAALIIACIVCLTGNRHAQRAQVLCCVVLASGIIVLFALVLARRPLDAAATPLFLPDVSPWFQALRMIAVVPWAYVGFESISLSSEEFAFSPARSFRIMVAAIGMAAVAYVSMLLISVSAIPAGYGSWVAYVRDLPVLGGITGTPTFSAISISLGNLGLAILWPCMLGALFSSLVGNITALSRLVCALVEKEVLPAFLGRLSGDGVPRNAILAIGILSLPIPLLGRTAIGWNVDISNVGATIVYGYTSVVAFRHARATGDARSRVMGLAGIIIAAVFLALMLLPGNSLAEESYLIFAGWVVLGLYLNHYVFAHDTHHRYGRSSVVWIALLILAVYTALSFIWQSSLKEASIASNTIMAALGSNAEPGAPLTLQPLVDRALEGYHVAQMRDVVVVIAIILFSFYILVANYQIMNRREMESELELAHTRDEAYTDKLTGMKSINAYRMREREVNDAIRAGTIANIAVAVCDVNDLKVVNDTWGHQAGDDFLRAGSVLISAAFPKSPVYRVGGDEFVVLLQGRAFEQCEELLGAFEEANEERQRTGGVVIAVGVSAWRPGRDDALSVVFSRADAIMYQRKRELKAMGGETRPVRGASRRLRGRDRTSGEDS